MCIPSFQYLHWTTAVKRSCVANRDKASPAMFWHKLCDARKTNALHHSCSVSWFISSSGYSNCQFVANCQCNVPLTAALHTFPSPRWPMPNSIFKFRRFETASWRAKEMKKKGEKNKRVALRNFECRYLDAAKVCNQHHCLLYTSDGACLYTVGRKCWKDTLTPSVLWRHKQEGAWQLCPRRFYFQWGSDAPTHAIFATILSLVCILMSCIWNNLSMCDT